MSSKEPEVHVGDLVKVVARIKTADGIVSDTSKYADVTAAVSFKVRHYAAIFFDSQLQTEKVHVFKGMKDNLVKHGLDITVP